MLKLSDRNTRRVGYSERHKRIQMSKSDSLLVSALFFMLLISGAISSDESFLLCLDVNSNPLQRTSQVTYTQLNSSFPSVLQAYVRNARFQRPGLPKPLFIIAARDVSNIQATLTCCRKLGFEMRIRSGGHDMEGLSYRSSVPFVILDMFNLRSIRVDLKTETAWVEAGATLGEVYYSIASKSPTHAFPGGVCPTVGTGGHFSGGGYGNLMRKYGLSSDNIVDALIVDVQGRVLNREAMGEDLFWALRGGGAASFGVVLAWKIRLVRVPPLVTVFRVQRSLNQGASHIVYRWQQVAPKLPKEMFIRVKAAVIKDEPKQMSSKSLKISFVGMFLGRAKRLVDMLAKRFPELDLSEEECTEMPWVRSVLFWANIPHEAPIEVLISREYNRVARKVKSDYVKTPMPRAALDKMWAKLLEMDGLVMEWNPYGGRMSKISKNETAYPYRAGNLFKIEYDFIWQKDGVEEEERHIQLSRRLYKFMTPYVSKFPRQAFFNYRDLDVGTNASSSYFGFGAKYYGSNFVRLAQVKTKVDALNFLKNEQSIPTITALVNQSHASNPRPREWKY